MTSPPGVSQPTHPGSPGQGAAWMMATVQSIDPANNTAVVQDQLTKTFNMPMNAMRAKGLPPAVGEQWIITREYGGSWAFAMLLNGSPTGEPIPQANVTGLPAQIAKIDPAIVRITAAEGALTSLGTSVNSSLAVPDVGEQWIFGDKMASMSRFHASNFIAFDAGAVTRYTLLGPCPRGGITVTVIRAAVVVVGAGSVSASVYTGTTHASMNEVANGSFVTTGADVKVASFSSLTIPEGMIVAVAFSSTDTTFRLAGAAFGGTPGVLITQTTKMAQGYNTSPFPPNSINMSASGGGITKIDSRIWCALA